MKPTERKCPHCGGIVKPVKRGGDPDAALAQHVELTHTTQEVKK